MSNKKVTARWHNANLGLFVEDIVEIDWEYYLGCAANQTNAEIEQLLQKWSQDRLDCVTVKEILADGDTHGIIAYTNRHMPSWKPLAAANFGGGHSKVKKCDCGCAKTYGPQTNLHADYCSLRRKNEE